MTITRAMAITVAVTCTAIGLASPAWADEQLDGDYTFVDGPMTTTWSITTQCSAELTCGGTVSTSRGWVGAINRVAGGPSTAARPNASTARSSPGGTTCTAKPLATSGPASPA